MIIQKLEQGSTITLNDGTEYLVFNVVTDINGKEFLGLSTQVEPASILFVEQIPQESGFFLRVIDDQREKMALLPLFAKQ